MHPIFRTLPIAALLALPLTAPAGQFLNFLQGKRDIEVIANTDVTPEGKAHPTASKTAPQYYIAVNLGYQDFGGVIAGITQPPSKDVIKLITAELAKQGFLPATDSSPPPSLVLTFAWGTLNTDEDFRFNGETGAPISNRQQIMRFLGGNKLGFDQNFFDPNTTPIAGLTTFDATARDLYDATSEDFYVTVVSAYDLESIKTKKRQLLWMTRIATFSRGFDLPDTLPTMIAIGGAYFGKETTAPVWKNASDRYKPDVKMGEIRLVEYLDGAKVPVFDASGGAKKPAATDPAGAAKKP